MTSLSGNPIGSTVGDAETTILSQGNPPVRNSSGATSTRLRPQLWIGVMCLLAFVILSDARDILLERHIKFENPYDYLLIVFSITAMFYCAVNSAKQMRSPTATTAGFSTNIAWLNLVTASNWLGWFLSLKYLTAPTVVALYAGMIPITTLVVNRVLRSTSTTSRADWISSLLLLSCAAVWALANVMSLQGTQALIGIALVFMSSVSIAATTVVSKRLADAHTPTSRIMAHRFYVLIAVAFLMSSPFTQLLDVMMRNYEVLLLAATVGTILSLWLLQKGIGRCEPVLTMVIIATSPAFSLALYFLLISGAAINGDTLALSISVVVIAVLHTLFQHKNQPTRRNS